MMYTALRRFVPMLAFFAAILMGTPAAADDVTDRSSAVTAATDEAAHWLATLDQRRFSDSWSDAAGVMKEGRRQSDWVEDIAESREMLGKTVMRQLRHAEYSSTVRGAPEGSYVTAEYLTQFSKAPPALETLLLTREGGRWRIAGYSLSRAPAPETPPVANDKAGGGPKPKAKE
jgi:hypothetical protein